MNYNSHSKKDWQNPKLRVLSIKGATKGTDTNYNTEIVRPTRPKQAGPVS